MRRAGRTTPPQQRRPIKGEEGADTAERERHHQTDRKRKTQRDDMQALLHRLRRERIEVGTAPMRRLAKQPFDAGAQTNKSGEEQQGLDPAMFTEARGDEIVTLLELVWQIGKRPGESDDVLADRSKTGIESLRNRLLWRGPLRCGFGLALLFEPIADLWNRPVTSSILGSASASPLRSSTASSPFVSLRSRRTATRLRKLSRQERSQPLVRRRQSPFCPQTSDRLLYLASLPRPR